MFQENIAKFKERTRRLNKAEIFKEVCFFDNNWQKNSQTKVGKQKAKILGQWVKLIILCSLFYHM